MVVAVAVTQAAVTASARYESGRHAIHDFLSHSADVIPPNARFTLLWPGQSAKPGRDARYILYPRRAVRLSARHTISPATARSTLHAAGVQYVVVLGGRTQSLEVATIAAAFRAPWSHLILRTDTGDVYQVDP